MSIHAPRLPLRGGVRIRVAGTLRPVDVDRELRTLATSARPRAVMALAAGAAVTAIGAGYVVALAALFGREGLPFAFLAAAALGAIPLIIGLTVAVRAGARLAALGRVAAAPERVNAVEMAFRYGKPAVRLGLDDGRSVVVGSSDLDRSQLDRAIRARLDGAGREPAGPYR
jgi:hypothetical protein